MKAIVFLLAFVTSTIFGATIDIGNLNDPDNSNGIVTAAGDLIEEGQGSIQVGYFTGDLSSLTLETVIERFVPYGEVLDFGAGFGAAGLFQGTISGDLVNSSQFAGEMLFVVITDSITGISGGGSSATEVFVWNSGISFPTTEPFSPSINVQEGFGSILFGEVGTYQVTFGDFGGTQAVDAFNLVSIPEPSTFLLGAFGALGLLRRRR